MIESSAQDFPPGIDFSQLLYAVVDRLVIRPDVRQRLIDSAELAYRETGETVIEILPSIVGKADSGRRWVFSERFECQNCKITYEEPRPTPLLF